MIRIIFGLFLIAAGAATTIFVSMSFLTGVAALAAIGIGYFLIIHSLKETKNF
jgi:hypothetical protein